MRRQEELYAQIAFLRKMQSTYSQLFNVIEEKIIEAKRELRKLQKQNNHTIRFGGYESSYEKYFAPKWCETKQEAEEWCRYNYGCSGNGVWATMFIDAYRAGDRFVVYHYMVLNDQ